MRLSKSVLSTLLLCLALSLPAQANSVVEANDYNRTLFQHTILSDELQHLGNALQSMRLEYRQNECERLYQNRSWSTHMQSVAKTLHGALLEQKGHWKFIAEDANGIYPHTQKTEAATYQENAWSMAFQAQNLEHAYGKLSGDIQAFIQHQQCGKTQ